MPYGGAWGLSAGDPGALITPGNDGTFGLQHNVGGATANMSGLDQGGVLGALGQIQGWGPSDAAAPAAPKQAPSAPVTVQPGSGMGGATSTDRTGTMTPAEVANKTALEQGDRWSPVGGETGPSYDDVLRQRLGLDQAAAQKRIADHVADIQKNGYQGPI